MQRQIMEYDALDQLLVCCIPRGHGAAVASIQPRHAPLPFARGSLAR